MSAPAAANGNPAVTGGSRPGSTSSREVMTMLPRVALRLTVLRRAFTRAGGPAGWAGWAGCALLAALAGVLLTATPAVSAEPGRLAVLNYDAYRAGVDPTQGQLIHRLAVTAPEACPSGTVRHLTKIVAVQATSPADQALANDWPAWGNLYAPVAIGLPGPLTAYPASMHLQALANLHGLRIVPGRYVLALQCQDSLGVHVLRQWEGSFVVDATSHYRIEAPYAAPAPSATQPPSSASPSGPVAPLPSVTAGPSSSVGAAGPSGTQPAAPSSTLPAGPGSGPGPGPALPGGPTPGADGPVAAGARAQDTGSVGGDAVLKALSGVVVVAGAVLVSTVLLRRRIRG